MNGLSINCQQSDASPINRRGHINLIRLGLMMVLLSIAACGQVNLPTSPIPLDPAAHGDICGLPPVASSANFWLLLTTGLLTGLSHCVGMCGPLVSMFAVRCRAEGQDLSTSLVIYQLGRLTTYLLFGALAGTIGLALRFTTMGTMGTMDAMGLKPQSILSILIGFLMLLMGLNLLGVLPHSYYSASLARRISRWMRFFLSTKHPLAPFALGITNGLLPCGAVYAMTLMAATSASPWRGASIMLIFGLGTLPSMLGIGLFASKLSLHLRRNMYRIAAMLVMLVGLQLTLRGLALSGVVSHLNVGGVVLW